MIPEFLWHHWAKRVSYRDPVIANEPHDLWMLPASLADYGEFTLLAERDFEQGPSRRLYLDIRIVENGEYFTLILPLTRQSSDWLTRWQRMGHPHWRFTVGRLPGDVPRWALDRPAHTIDYPTHLE